MKKGELELEAMDNGIRFAFVIEGGGYGRGREFTAFWLDRNEAEVLRDKIDGILREKP